MIKYAETEVGDVLRVVGLGAPGYAEVGDLVRVKSVHVNSVKVEDRDGAETEFIFNCGAARLEPTEWKRDFPQICECGGVVEWDETDTVGRCSECGATYDNHNEE